MAAPDGHIHWYNRRWYEYTGSTPAEMEDWGWQSVHNPVELPAVLKRWRSAIASGAPFEMTFPLLDAAGRFRPFLTRIVPSRDANGAVTAWYGVNTDVSEQVQAEQALRRAEAALRDLNAGLEREVEQRTREANKARAQAEAANKAKSDFLASMSHEIPTPLHGVLGYADLLRDTDTLTPRQTRQLERLQTSGVALITVVNDVHRRRRGRCGARGAVRGLRPRADGRADARHGRHPGDRAHPQAAASTSRLPIIAMTANVLPQQVAQFRAAGIDDHVGKPFKRDELYATIARWGAREPQAW